MTLSEALRLARCGWQGEQGEQRRGLLSERPRDGGPSRSHRGRAKKTAALLSAGAGETDPPAVRRLRGVKTRIDDAEGKT